MAEPSKKNTLAIVVSKGTLDSVYPSLIMATSAVAGGMTVHLYFTFGGMKLLNRHTYEQLEASEDLGVSTEELKQLLGRGGMPSPREMLKRAKESGVKIHACSPTMNLYGTKKEDLIPEVDDIIGASTYLDYASDPDAITLFI